MSVATAVSKRRTDLSTLGKAYNPIRKGKSEVVLPPGTFSNILEKEEVNFVGPLKISIPEQLATNKNIEVLDAIFKRYPGQTEVQLLMKSSSGVTPYRLKHKVFVGDALISEVKQHFGTSALDNLVELSEVKSEEVLESVAGDDIAPLVVEQTGELFGQ
jgi:hypothetical protein